MKLTINIPGIPQPKQSIRARIINTKAGKSFIHTYQKKEVVENERSIKMIIMEQLPNGFMPIQGGIRVKKLHYIFPPVSSLKKAEINHINAGGFIPKTTKPDLTDNLNKGLFDAMQGIVFINDSQICSMNNLEKSYGQTPGIKLELETLDESSLFNN
jgi:Holliday junction resolvase RusA-like endonuclease